jgi:hypothetical protein
MAVLAQTAELIPSLEKGRVAAEGDPVGINLAIMTPARLASRADLPLSGGGTEFA